MMLAAGAGAALALVAPLMAATTSPAFAASRDGDRDSGEFCYYYNSIQAGQVSDFTGSVSDLGATQPSCYEFKGAGAGQGVCEEQRGISADPHQPHGAGLLQQRLRRSEPGLRTRRGRRSQRHAENNYASQRSSPGDGTYALRQYFHYVRSWC